MSHTLFTDKPLYAVEETEIDPKLWEDLLVQYEESVKTEESNAIEV